MQVFHKYCIPYLNPTRWNLNYTCFYFLDPINIFTSTRYILPQSAPRVLRITNTLIASVRTNPLYFLIRCAERQSHLSTAPFRFPRFARESLSGTLPAKLNSILSRFLVCSPSSALLYILLIFFSLHVNKKLSVLLYCKIYR